MSFVAALVRNQNCIESLLSAVGKLYTPHKRIHIERCSCDWSKLGMERSSGGKIHTIALRKISNFHNVQKNNTDNVGSTTKFVFASVFFFNLASVSLVFMKGRFVYYITDPGQTGHQTTPLEPLVSYNLVSLKERLLVIKISWVVRFEIRLTHQWGCPNVPFSSIFIPVGFRFWAVPHSHKDNFGIYWDLWWITGWGRS